MWRLPITTTLTWRNNLQSDLWYITDEVWARITNELWQKILFHIWIFYWANTVLTGRDEINTILN